ncbi:MAG: hypothetical protein ACE14S_05315 [Candidatus Bathyarchaeia archaeon]
MKVLIELQEEELRHLIDCLIIYRSNVRKIMSENSYRQISALIEKLDGESKEDIRPKIDCSVRTAAKKQEAP